MDLDGKKPVCGTCANWGGKRDWAEDGTIRVSAAAKGLCEKLKKFKAPQGGCDFWTQCCGN
ncbi:MAG: hypothetical protein P4L43_00145 [Syntrophobacteraceae bacterium]|nr:hypothetical protein [Syntrophobacteraceae bacterium]